MTAGRYVNSIVKKIKCNSKKKKEIGRQLLLDIDMRIQQGEKLEDVISQMGTVKEIADSFNENISVEEQKKYVRNKILKIVIPLVLILSALICIVYLILPKSFDIEKSIYFDKIQVENAMKDVIEFLDAKDYTSLKENSIVQMQNALEEKTIESAKKQISDNWGERVQFERAYISELVQMNKHYAVGEITVTYSNVSVVYTILFDKNMQLAGLYMR